MQEKRFFVVTGMHRSHTSLLANILSICKIRFHSEMVGANSSNPYGHFEDIGLLRIIEDILEDNSAKWFRNIERRLYISDEREVDLDRLIEKRFEELGSDWGFKTPHSTLIVDSLAKFPSAQFIFIYRDPRAVMSSLLRRMGKQIYWRPDAVFLFAKSYAVYNERIADFYHSNSERCYIVSSAQLIKDPAKEVAKLNHHFNIPLSSEETVKALVHPDTISAPSSKLERFYTYWLSKTKRVTKAFERLEKITQDWDNTLN